MAVDERVKDILVEQLGVDPAEVIPDASLPDDLGFDSLDLAEMLIAFKNEFGIEIPEDDAEKLFMSIVQNVVTYVENVTA